MGSRKSAYWKKGFTLIGILFVGSVLAHGIAQAATPVVQDDSFVSAQ